MDMVMNLMRQVEVKENDAKQAKVEADRCNLRVLAKVDRLNRARHRAKEKNDMVINL